METSRSLWVKSGASTGNRPPLDGRENQLPNRAVREASRCSLISSNEFRRSPRQTGHGTAGSGQPRAEVGFRSARGRIDRLNIFGPPPASRWITAPTFQRTASLKNGYNFTKNIFISDFYSDINHTAIGFNASGGPIFERE
jgi:hypothetical protein